MKTISAPLVVMNFTANALLAMGASLFSLGARADEPAAYSLEVARAQGDLNCQVSRANGGSVNCSANFKAQAKTEIKMSQTPDKKSHFGIDII